jgi:hypothetical protein
MLFPIICLNISQIYAILNKNQKVIGRSIPFKHSESVKNPNCRKLSSDERTIKKSVKNPNSTVRCTEGSVLCSRRIDYEK